MPNERKRVSWLEKATRGLSFSTLVGSEIARIYSSDSTPNLPDTPAEYITLLAGAVLVSAVAYRL